MRCTGKAPRSANGNRRSPGRDADLPDDLVLIPGVIAGTDCGFATFAGFGVVDPEIVFAKLRALAEGAAIASEELF